MKARNRATGEVVDVDVPTAADARAVFDLTYELVPDPPTPVAVADPADVD